MGGDTITMHYSPSKVRAQLWFEKNGLACQYGDGMTVDRRMGLQYRMCIFMGDYGEQIVELESYERIGDAEESASESESSSSDDDSIAAAADVDTSESEESGSRVALVIPAADHVLHVDTKNTRCPNCIIL